MNTIRVASPRLRLLRRLHSGQRSSALVIVLGCLVLITVLIVAFLANVTTERQSAKFYANSSSVKLLADSTVSIVMGQIKDATRGTDTSGATLAWASQPGMIRNYDTKANPDGYYKLYSWTNMVGSGAFNPGATGETPPSTWTNSPALYTDLNDPVYRNGMNVYPIVDPAAVNFVQGFSISNTAPVSSSDAAPMPVQWLYVLQDGSLAPAGDSGSGTTANVPGASASNPIVARVAFWADDDTSKININTAAGDDWISNNVVPPIGNTGNPGSFWDTPRTTSGFEETNLSIYQPAQGEYQRYPGHPATTYLSAVFPNLTTTNIYQIVPRITQGGSMSGTQVATNVISPDSDRLYASVDELAFATNRLLNSNSPLTTTNIEQAKFFLTAHSRSPEVNLYNQPRVVIWPVSSTNDNQHRTPYDNLIAYCGTLNNYIYYFQRSNPNSATVDLPSSDTTPGLGRNRDLIMYLRSLTSQAVPGFSTGGETFASKYPMDRDEILTEIFDYVRALNSQDTSSSVSGFVPFTTTSVGAAGEGQIVPIQDDSHSDSNKTNRLRGMGRFPVITEASLLFIGTAQTTTTGSSIVATTPASTPPAVGKTRVQAAFLVKFYQPSPGYAPYYANFQVRVTNLDKFNWSPDGTTYTPMGFTPSGTVTITPTAPGANGDTGSQPFALGAGYNLFSGTLDCASTTTTITSTFSIQDNNQLKLEILDSTGSTTLQTYNLDFPAGNFPVPQLAPEVQDSAGGVNKDFRKFSDRFSTTGAAMSRTYFCLKDTVRSIAANTDPRVIAGLSVVNSSMFSPINQYNSTTPLVHGMEEFYNGNYRLMPGLTLGKLANGVTYSTVKSPYYTKTGSLATSFTSPPDFTYTGLEPDHLQQIATSGGVTGAAAPDPIMFTLSGSYSTAANGVYAGTNAATGTIPGDWDNGAGSGYDGAYVNKADEGARSYVNGTGSTLYPYFGAGYNGEAAGATFFSPNRQMPSAVMFGSLPTGVISNRPWQTLLFRPAPDDKGTASAHLGAQSPPDYLLLDLFNMPIVEPYAISDPFSTAGKINMNYQIVPFTYLNRSTGVQAVLRPEQMLIVPGSDGQTYKSQAPSSEANPRYYLDLVQTLTGFQNMFDHGTTDSGSGNPDIFRSAAQICNIWLVPTGLGQTYSSMPTFWGGASGGSAGTALTGDNSREKTYANLYPRFTTKSNTYTVHYRVQTLKKLKTTSASQWLEGTDLVTGEYRGSSTIERYLDVSNTSIPDYATASNPPPLDNFYKFRVVETKQFTP